MLMSVLCINSGAADLTSAQLSEQKLRKADINSNGTFDLDDAQKLLKAAAGIEADNVEKYDIDSDGYTSVQDAILVLRQAAGTGSVLTDEEAIELFNAKLNNVKNRETGLPGFTKETTAKCSSMKITQKVEASGFASLVAGQLACTDMEYDKYVEKMVNLLQTSKPTPEEQANINALKQSAIDYKKAQTETEIGKVGDYVSHFLYFPRDAKNTASEITTNDISSIVCELKNGTIVYTVKLPNKSYTSLTAYNQNTYAKVMNVVDFDDGNSTLKKANLNNGLIVLVTDATTGAMKTVTYSYDYYSEVAAPTQSQSDSQFGSVKIDMTTKTTASIVEKVTF